MVEDAAEGMVEVVIAEVVMGVVATVIAESACIRCSFNMKPLPHSQ